MTKGSSAESFMVQSETTAIDSICLGSGRFLRAVLVPALVAAGYHPAIVQTRGRSFLDYTLQSSEKNGWKYEVDTVSPQGSIDTTQVSYWAAGTLGSPQGKKDVLEILCRQIGASERPVILGIGVTEAGLSNARTQAMQDLYEVLCALALGAPKVSVINTDNVAKNGMKLRGFMNDLAETHGNNLLRDFLNKSVSFHNTMVDRITSQRPSNGLIPRAEPTPLKALVIEDLDKALVSVFSHERLRKDFGVVIRSSPGQLDADIALKLRIANGTHTAIAHTMALTGRTLTDILSHETDTTSRLFVRYLDALYHHQIAPGIADTTDFSASAEEANHVYEDWRQRLRHAHFGLSTFFITQNGAAKGGIRIGPTVRDLISNDRPVSCATAYALAAILRFLTPSTSASGTIYRGWLDKDRNSSDGSSSESICYADGLSYNLQEGWYEFRCACTIILQGEKEQALPEALASLLASTNDLKPVESEPYIRAYLQAETGGNLSSVADSPAFQILTKAIASLYVRMTRDSMVDILQSLDLQAGCQCLVETTI